MLKIKSVDINEYNEEIEIYEEYENYKIFENKNSIIIKNYENNSNIYFDKKLKIRISTSNYILLLEKNHKIKSILKYDNLEMITYNILKEIEYKNKKIILQYDMYDEYSYIHTKKIEISFE